jgi:hypothetical protein
MARLLEELHSRNFRTRGRYPIQKVRVCGDSTWRCSYIFLSVIPQVSFYGDGYQNSTHPVLFCLLFSFYQMAHGNTLNTMRPDATGSDSEDDDISFITRSSVDSQATVLYDPIGDDNDNSISTAGSLIIDSTQAGLPVLPVQIPYQYEE